MAKATANIDERLHEELNKLERAVEYIEKLRESDKESKKNLELARNEIAGIRAHVEELKNLNSEENARRIETLETKLDDYQSIVDNLKSTLNSVYTIANSEPDYSLINEKIENLNSLFSELQNNTIILENRITGIHDSFFTKISEAQIDQQNTILNQSSKYVDEKFDYFQPLLLEILENKIIDIQNSLSHKNKEDFDGMLGTVNTSNEQILARYKQSVEERFESKISDIKENLSKEIYLINAALNQQSIWIKSHSIELLKTQFDEKVANLESTMLQYVEDKEKNMTEMIDDYFSTNSKKIRSLQRNILILKFIVFLCLIIAAVSLFIKFDITQSLPSWLQFLTNSI